MIAISGEGRRQIRQRSPSNVIGLTPSTNIYRYLFAIILLWGSLDAFLFLSQIEA